MSPESAEVETTAAVLVYRQVAEVGQTSASLRLQKLMEVVETSAAAPSHRRQRRSANRSPGLKPFSRHMFGRCGEGIGIGHHSGGARSRLGRSSYSLGHAAVVGAINGVEYDFAVNALQRVFI